MNEPIDVEKLNDHLAEEHSIDDYYARAPLPIRVIEQLRLRTIKRMIGPTARVDLVEIGSGGGHVLRMFPTARLTAIDISPLFLATAKKNLRGYDARFLKGEVDKMDLPPASVDRVICTEVLEHTTNPEAILATIARILRPDGVACITVPNDPLIHRLMEVLKHTPLYRIYGDKLDWGADKYHLHQWTPDEFHDVLSRHFRVTEQSCVPLDALPIRACYRCVLR